MVKSKILCDLDKKKIEKKLSDISRLVNNPKYICRKCARAANHEFNLCKPVKINSL
jgi:hypothetical protein